MSTCRCSPSRLEAAGEAGPNPHLAGCGDCRARLEALARDTVRLRTTAGYRRAASALEVVRAAPRPRWWLRLAWVPALAAGVIWWRAQSGAGDGDLVKGSPVVAVLRAGDGTPVHAAKPGDRVALRVGGSALPWLFIVGLSDGGRVEALWPPETKQSGANPGGGVLSPEFSITPGSLTVAAVFSDKPQSLEALQQELTHAAPGGRGSPGAGRSRPGSCASKEPVHALALIALVATQAASDPAAAPLPRRFVLAVGENHGDPQDDPLRYAEADARAFVGTLEAVGGVAPENATLLVGAPAGDVRAALGQIDRRLRDQGQPGDQLILYVSSHADEGELHLGGTRLSMAELVGDLKRSPAAVAILIVDSCSSGALVRLKGMKPLVGQGPGSTVSLEVPETTGRVIIASSGADESSQEVAVPARLLLHPPPHRRAARRRRRRARRPHHARGGLRLAMPTRARSRSTFGTRARVQQSALCGRSQGGAGRWSSPRCRGATSRVVIDARRPPANGSWRRRTTGPTPT